MKLTGFIRGEKVIVAISGVEYSYEMLGERDGTLMDGDEVSFDTLGSSAINIERAAKAEAKEPQNGNAKNTASDERERKKAKKPAKNPTDQKRKIFSFEFVSMDDPNASESIESKFYTDPIRMSGIKAHIMPIILISIALIFRAQITEALLSFKQIEAYVNQNTVSLTFDLFIYLIFALSYILPLNQVFIFLSAATHDQYAVRQITNYNIFLIICVVATVLQSEAIGLDAHKATFSIAVMLFGLLSYCYKLKAFLYLIIKTKGSLPFLIALIAELGAIVAIGMMDMLSGAAPQITQSTGIDFNTMAWKHIVIFTLVSPFYILSFICLRRIKNTKI